MIESDASPPSERQPAELLTASSAAIRRALGKAAVDELFRRPAPGEWSVWDIAYHVAQIEVWYVAKLCEAAATDAPEALRLFLSAWDALRAQAVALAGRVPAERLDEAGLLGGVPDWTPRLLIERIAAHDHEHAKQARRARRGAQ